MSENDQTEILKEILKWIKVSSYREVKDFLNSILKTNTEKLIYQYSNGKNTSTEVVKKAKSSTHKVSDSWKEWKKLGIGDIVEVKGGKRFKRTFDLSDFGLLPESTQNSSQKEGNNDA